MMRTHILWYLGRACWLGSITAALLGQSVMAQQALPSKKQLRTAVRQCQEHPPKPAWRQQRCQDLRLLWTCDQSSQRERPSPQTCKAREALLRLDTIPVFTIVDTQQAFVGLDQPTVKGLTAQQRTTLDNTITPFFLDHQDAAALLMQLKAEGQAVQVQVLTLRNIYQTLQQNQRRYPLIPSQRQVAAARTIIRQRGRNADAFEGIPLFLMNRKNEPGSLVLRGQVPLFFDQKDLKDVLKVLKQKEPKLADLLEIEVMPLRRVLETLFTDSDPSVRKIVLYPSFRAKQAAQRQFNRQQTSQSQPPIVPPVP